MLFWSLDALRGAEFERAVVVVAPNQSKVHQLLTEYGDRNRNFVVRQVFQNDPLGTGHAAREGLGGLQYDSSSLSLRGRTILIVTGDTPLLRPETLRDFVSFHRQGGHAVSLIAFRHNNPTGYGRVLLDESRQFLAIREERDCSPKERGVDLCNSGIMCIESNQASELFNRLDRNNAAHEYYLTDVPAIARDLLGQHQSPVGVYISKDAAEFEGVNNQEQLANATGVLRSRVIRTLMAEGVLFESPDTAWVEDTVTFGADVVVEPFVVLRGSIHISDGARVRSGTGISH
jgi:bifunctional UDP-N-acetylglucosamine pyrophosphorylase/glucosamine-1-phosphate N-acetyltransferase